MNTEIVWDNQFLKYQIVRICVRIEFCFMDGLQCSRNASEHFSSMDLASVSIYWL